MYKSIFLGVLIGLSCSFSNNVLAQIIHLDTLCFLPNIINEASGVEYQAQNVIWLHNDSGAADEIFRINESGNILKTIEILNDDIRDLEDVTLDDAGNLYLGDFGNNNSHAREDLKILKIPNVYNVWMNEISASEIYFYYPDQTAFPPEQEYRNFDCESLIYHNNNLHLFSKNWGESTFTRHYTLPTTPGEYAATLIDSFDTGGWITGADLNPSNTILALLSNEYIWVFYDFEGDDFFGGQAVKIDIPYAKREGISFVDETSIYVVDEVIGGGEGGMLNYLDLQEVIDFPQPLTPIEIGDSMILISTSLPIIENTLKIFPNPTTDKINMTLPPTTKEIKLLDSQGKEVLSQEIERTQTNHELSVAAYKAGVYHLQIVTEHRIYKEKIIIQ